MKRLTNKEEQIMQILWKLEKGFVNDILQELPEPKPHYNTVSSTVRLLEEKGYIGHKAYGKTHEYFPILKKEDYRTHSLARLVSGYFANSYKGIISALAQEEKISVDELKEIIEMIENTESDQHD